MKYYVFVYDQEQDAFFSVGEFDDYDSAAKHAVDVLYSGDWYLTCQEDVKILAHFPGLDDWREV